MLIRGWVVCDRMMFLGASPKYGDARLSQIQEIATFLISNRRDVALGSYGEPHDCMRQRCGPYTCEMDVMAASRNGGDRQIQNPCVYVCRMGQIHVCTPDECAYYVGTHEGTCTLTNLFHGHTRGDTGYVPPDKRTWHFKRGDTKPAPSQSMRKAGKEHGFAAPPPMVVEYRRRLAASTGQPSAPSDVAAPTAAASVSGPVTTPTITSKFDLATFDPFKVPYASTSKKDAAAPLAAAAVAAETAIVKKRPKNGKKPQPQPQPQQQQQVKKRKLHRDLLKNENEIARLSEVAENIIVALLFSDKRRQFNDKKRLALDNQRAHAIAAYYESRKRVIPIGIEVAEILARFDQHALYLAILNRNNALINYYVRVAIETWRVVANSPWAEENPGAGFERFVCVCACKCFLPPF